MATVCHAEKLRLAVTAIAIGKNKQALLIVLPSHPVHSFHGQLDAKCTEGWSKGNRRGIDPVKKQSPLYRATDSPIIPSATERHVQQ